MPQQTKIFRVFISSTFTDMKEERRLLQKNVFPKLEKFCEENGAKFQAVDLRWGVTEESQLNQKTLDICLNEIARCQKITPKPNFILLLGDKYGWQPLPTKIPEDEMKKIHFALEHEEKELIKKWYRLDENAVPAEYVLQPRGEKYAAYREWEKIETEIRSNLRNAVSKLSFKDEQSVKYFASATHQEIIRGALHPPDGTEKPEEHVFAMIRETEGLPRDKAAEGFIDLEDGTLDAYSKDHLDNLKKELRRKLTDNYIAYSARWKYGKTEIEDPEEFESNIYNFLEDIIKQQIEVIINPDEIEHEAKLHSDFKEELTKHFYGRHEILKKIESYLNDPSDHRAMSMIGESGSGKSSVVAKAIQEYKSNNKNSLVVYRFIGTTSNSSNIISLLQSICGEIAREFGETLESIAGESREKSLYEMTGMTEIFKKCLALANEQKPVVLFLDALDQLSDSDNAQALYWLPKELPGYTKLVASSLPELETNLSGTIIERLPLLPESEAKQILDRWFKAINRKLTQDQQKEVIQKFNQNGLAIFLKLAFERAKQWHSYDADLVVQNDVKGIINDFIDILEEEHGKEFVEHVLCYMLSGRYQGLTENEILEILVFDKEFWEHFLETTHPEHRKELKGVTQIPIVVWSRLYLDMEAFLTERDADGVPIITFFHRQFIEVVRERYFLINDQIEDNHNKFYNETMESNSIEYHKKLGEYFDSKNYFLESIEQQKLQAKRLPPTPRSVNVRKVVELPWQKLLTRNWEEIEKLFTDLFFLESKSECGKVFDLAADFLSAVTIFPKERKMYKILSLLEEAINRDIHFIAKHPTVLFQCLWNSCWWYDCSEVSMHYDLTQVDSKNIGPIAQGSEENLSDLLTQWRKQAVDIDQRRWVRSLRPPSIPLGCGQRLILRGHEKGVTCFAFSPDGRRVASGAIDESVRLWDAESGNPLEAICQLGDSVSSLAFTLDGISLVFASRGSINIWMPNSGKVVRSVSQLSGHGRKIALFPDGNRIATCAVNDDAIRIFDLTTGREITRIKPGGNGPTASIAISPNGQVVAASLNHSIHVWKSTNLQEITVLRGHMGPVSVLCFSNNGLFLLSGSWDYDVRLWDTNSWEFVQVLGGGDASITAANFSPDDEQIVVSSGHDRKIRIWETKTGKQLEVLKGHDGFVSFVAFSLDGKFVGSSSDDGTVRLWEWRKLRPVPTLVGHHGHYISNRERVLLNMWDIDWVRFLSDGKRLLTVGGLDLVIWDVRSCRQLRSFRCQSGAPSPIALYPDDTKLATCWNKIVNLWNIETGEKVARLEGHEGKVVSLAFSPDGKTIATGCEVVDEHKRGDGTIQLWNCSTGKLLSVIRKCGLLNCLAFSRDGLRLVCGYSEGKVRVWDIAVARVIAVFEGIGGEIVELRVSLDDRCIIGISLHEPSWYYRNRKATTFVLDSHTGAQLEIMDGRGDLDALASQSFRYVAVNGEVESVIKDKHTLRPVVWFSPPLQHIAAHPSGSMWAGVVGKHLYLFSLEGAT